MGNINNPYVREIPFVSAIGYGTAESLAKMYGIIANGGKTEDGKVKTMMNIKILSKFNTLQNTYNSCIIVNVMSVDLYNDDCTSH